MEKMIIHGIELFPYNKETKYKLSKWLRKDLEQAQKEGYQICPCKSEDEALQVKDTLKADKRCAQCGYIVNKENYVVYFVITKERSQRGVKSGQK